MKRKPQQPEVVETPSNGSAPQLPKNPLLPANMQGSAYKVVGFKLVPILSLLDKKGAERGLIESPVAVRAFQAQFYTPMPKVIKDAGLAMESKPKG